WAATPPVDRAKILNRAADLLEARMEELLGLIIREAGKSAANAVGEVREAVDFLRYYAAEVDQKFDNATHAPLGTVVCISPWNFPLSIFLGQVSAALAAGNAVIAKPAEETPLIAAAGIAILHEAGVPRSALQFLPGAGDVGALLVVSPIVGGVVFTGSTEVARLIQQELARRLSPQGQPIPLIAETAGQNAMIVDSSALSEQAVGDVLASAFDSAGQRCSALRVVCLQDDVAQKTLTMLKGAMADLRVGNPDRLATDVGPVISAEAREKIVGHIDAMRAKGHAVTQAALAPEADAGTFVPPTIIELSKLDELRHEVFGPVLHVVRYKREDLDALVDDINRLGYGLTFGLHTRLDETIERVTERISVGNIYVNRNIIGAVVGVQPFGGHGLSGTGPKAGGPLYLRRLARTQPLAAFADDGEGDPAMATAHFADWLAANDFGAATAQARKTIAASPFGYSETFAGPVGEDNTYRVTPRGRILAIAATADGLFSQLAAIFATGNAAIVMAPAQDSTMAVLSPPSPLRGGIEGGGGPNTWSTPPAPTRLPPPSPQGGGELGHGLASEALDSLPSAIAKTVARVHQWSEVRDIAGVLVEGDRAAITVAALAAAGRDGPIVNVQGVSPEGLADGSQAWNLDLLVTEVSTSINTAAAGGNASLMTLGMG
ncbi:MAG: L-glutamate gamma-semialdehyde dehydrogenase, partial [Devosia sp.]